MWSRTSLRPPRVTEWLLRLSILPGIRREDIVGSLCEEFLERAEAVSERRAKGWYRRQAIGLIAREVGSRAASLARELGGWEMSSILMDLRYAARGVVKRPVFGFVATATLALGIGATTAIFAVVNGVLLDPLPFEDPDELVSVWHTAPGWGFDDVPVAINQWATYKGESRTFEDIGLWAVEPVSITGLGDPERVSAVGVTGELLPLLGVQASMGRRFTEADDAPGALETIMLSHGYWIRRFGGDPSVLGSSVRVNGRQREIIGVLPPDFALPQDEPEILFPFQFDRGRITPGGFNYQAIARLSPNTSIEQAATDVERLIPMATELYGGTPIDMLEAAGFAPNLRFLERDYVGDIAGALWVLLGTVGIVLLIACANVANLFIVRMEGRRQEVSLRAALGAARGRIARQYLVEGLMLALLGGLFGLVLALGGVRLLVWLGPEGLPRLANIAVGPEVVAAALGLSIASGLVLGLLPIPQTRGHELMATLKEGGRGRTASRSRRWVKDSLVVVQVAMALVLLTGSGLMIRTLQALREVDPGFSNPEEVVTFRVAIPAAEIAEDREVLDAYEEIWGRIAAIDGVVAVGASSSLTMEGFHSNDGLYFEDDPPGPGESPPVERMKWISGDYFETLRQPIVVGRAIEWRDIRDGTPVAVVSQNLAERHWGEAGSALGHRITWGNPESTVWSEIVGVVANERDDGVDHPARAVVYWPLGSANPRFPAAMFVQRSMSYAVRTDQDAPSGLIPNIREAVRGVNPNLAMAGVSTLRDILDRSMARTSFTLVLLAIAAVVALALGVVGIYGVISYVVSQRTREIGVRMALGADRRDVSRMVLKQGMILASVGVAVGLVAALGLTRLMSSLLYGVEATDPVTFGVVAALVTAVALVASYVPAFRASRTDPLEALRFQ